MTPRHVAAYIRIEALRSNFRKLKALAGKARVCAVIKADAYGHGAALVSRILEEEGVEYLAVAFLEEALELRRAGVGSPILVLGVTDPSNADDVVSHSLTQTVADEALAVALSSAARRAGKTAKIHIKIDTGMHRQGIGLNELPAFARRAAGLASVEIEGAYSHFADADARDGSFTAIQFSRFLQGLDILNAEGLNIPLRHVANSAALLHHPETCLDMVRPGILLYGLSPDGSVEPPEGFSPVMRLCASVVSLRWIEPGESVSYGRIFTARRRTRLALLQIGYADGYRRGLSNRAWAMIRGEKCPQVGRVCMDQTLFDVTDVPCVKAGDEATLFGAPGMYAGHLASIESTIDYEITCGVTKRVPRIPE